MRTRDFYCDYINAYSVSYSVSYPVSLKPLNYQQSEICTHTYTKSPQLIQSILVVALLMDKAYEHGSDWCEICPPHWLGELHFLLLIQKSLQVCGIMIYDESVSILNSQTPPNPSCKDPPRCREMLHSPFISVESITPLIGNNYRPLRPLDSNYSDTDALWDPAPKVKLGISRA